MTMKEMLQAARQKRPNPPPAAAVVPSSTEALAASLSASSISSPAAVAASPGKLNPEQQAVVAEYSKRDFQPTPDQDAVVHSLSQFCLTSASTGLPPSCYLIPSFISPSESDALLSLISESPQCMWHQLKRRRLQMWGGFPASTASGEDFKPDPLPRWQERLIDRLCETVRLDSAESAAPAVASEATPATAASPSPSFFPPSLRPNHVLLNQYASGEGIMPHQDGPAYEPRVAILSLGSHTVMRFYKELKDAQPSTHQPALSVYIPPRSLLLFTSSLYSTYFHAIDERAEDEITREIVNAPEERRGQTIARETRVSLTIRRVKNREHPAERRADDSS